MSRFSTMPIIYRGGMYGPGSRLEMPPMPILPYRSSVKIVSPELRERIERALNVTMPKPIIPTIDYNIKYQKYTGTGKKKKKTTKRKKRIVKHSY